MEGRILQAILNEQGERTTASVVSFGADGQVLVGERAQQHAPVGQGLDEAPARRAACDGGVGRFSRHPRAAFRRPDAALEARLAPPLDDLLGDPTRRSRIAAHPVTIELMPTSFPDWVEPMAAMLTQERFAGPEWIFERKHDGIRLLAFKQGKAVRLLSRNRLPQDLPAVAEAVADLPVRDGILDGEVTWGSARLAYHVFDVLWLDGRDVTELPLDERRALLSRLPLRPPLHRVTAVEDPRPWERAAREGWEGVIAKRRDSPYEHRRSPHWLKMKCEATQELVVGGFTDPQRRRVGLGALLVGYFDGEDLAYAGKVGTGFDTMLLLQLRARLDALEIPGPPFTRGHGLPRLGVHWARPELVVQVAFTEWTVHGKLRHPRLLGIRTDKPAREVVREAT